MPLLQSQFETLEEPSPDEAPLVVSAAASPREIAHDIIAALGLGLPAAARSLS